MKKLLAKIRKLLRDRRTRQIITRFVSITAAVVVFVTTYALVLPAITMESEAYCGIPAHQHSDDCYELQLVCEIPESPGHHHSDACYSVNQVLVCETEEHEHSVDNGCYDDEGNLTCTKAEHTHNADDNCYEEERVLICEEEESEGHQHTNDCYEKVLTCGLEVHTHSTECYVNPDSGATTEAAVEASTGASTGAAAASTGVSSTGATEDGSVEYDFEEGSEATGNGDNSNTGATDASENATTALTTVENATAGVTADGHYVPQLDPVNFSTMLDSHTGIYYHSVADGEVVEDSTSIPADGWNRVDNHTELGVNDLLRVYLSYSIPAGSLNPTNPVARYRLPANLHLTDAQVNAINSNVNGIAGQYVDMDTLEILDVDKYYAYLGVEAVEGDRRPDEDPEEYLADVARRTGNEAAEYISALVRVEDVFDEHSGEYEGTDLVVTFTPYSIEKNQHEYDSDGQPTKAGQEIQGWLTLDFNLSQVDWDETSVDTFERETEVAVDGAAVDEQPVEDQTDEQTVEDNSDDQAVDETGSTAVAVETVEHREQTADIVFVEEGRDEENHKIDEISTKLTVVDEAVVDVHTVDNQPAVDDATVEDQGESDGEGATEETAAAATEEAAVEDTSDESTIDETSALAEKDKTDTAENAESVVIMPAMSFNDKITVRTGKPAGIDDNAGGTVANAADSLPEEAEVTVRVEADEGTFPAGTTMVLKAVDQKTLDGLADTLAETVESTSAVDSSEDKQETAEDSENEKPEEQQSENTAEEQKNIKTYGFQAVDITFIDAEGNEVEPAKPVRVALTSETVEQARKDAENSSVIDPVVVHVDDEGNTEQMDLVAPEEIEPAQGRSEEEIEREMEAAKAADTADTASTADAAETDSAVDNDAAVNDDAASDTTVDNDIDTTDTDTTDDAAQSNTGEDAEPMEGETNAEATDAEAESSTVGFTTDSFSVYAIVYTVDFHYDVDGQTYDYSINGGDVIGLKELLPILNVITDDETTEGVDEVQTFINDIEDVRFSDESRVKVARIETDTTAGQLKEKIKNETGAEPEYSGELTEEQIAEMNAKELVAVDWALVSMKAFGSEESLTITMKSEESWTIRVTDARTNKVTVHFVNRNGQEIEGVQYTGTNSYVTANPDGKTYNVPFYWNGNNGTVNLQTEFSKDGYTYASTHLAGSRRNADNTTQSFTYDGLTIDAVLREKNNNLYIYSDNGIESEYWGAPRTGNRNYMDLYEFNIDSTVNVPQKAVGTTTNVSFGPYITANTDKDIYVILDPVPTNTPYSSGNNNNSLDVPDPEFEKKLISNHDGTYTLSLSVTGHGKNIEDKTKANVIFIVDTSSSMRKKSDNADVTGEPSRLTDTKSELKVFAKTLLDLNTAPGKDSDTIEAAMISFDGATVREQGWTTSYSSLSPAIDGLAMHTGTDWEDALKDAYELGRAKKASEPNQETYIVFFTDGEASQYTNFNGTGEYTGQNRGYRYWYSYFLSRESAKDEARAIVNDDLELYTIFAYNPVTSAYQATGEHGNDFLHNLTKYAYGVGETISLQNDRYYYAENTTQLKDAFTAILNRILESVGTNNVSVNDNITSLTSVGVSIINGNYTGFKYTRSGGTYGTDQTWSGAPSATYDSGGVHWDLSSLGMLEDGVTYKVSFVVWPSQDAYDWVADLNNGIREWTDLVAANLQDHFLRVPDSSTPSGYRYEVATNPNSYNQDGTIAHNLITYTKTHKEILSTLPSGATVNTPVVVTDPITGTKTTTTYIRNSDGTYTKQIVKEARTAFGPPDLNMGLEDSVSAVEKIWDVGDQKELLAAYLYSADTGASRQISIPFQIIQSTVSDGSGSSGSGNAQQTIYKTVNLGWKTVNGVTGYHWVGATQNVEVGGETVPIGTRWREDFDIAVGLMLSETEALARGIDITDTDENDPEHGKYKKVYLDPVNKTSPYYVLEVGHDYDIKEPTVNYRFDFLTETSHPMLVDGKLKDVTIDYENHKILGISPEGNDTSLSSLSARNAIRGELTLDKIVWDYFDHPVSDCDDIFPITVTLTNQEGKFYIGSSSDEENVPWYGVERTVSGETEYCYYHKYDEEGNIVYVTESEAAVNGDYDHYGLKDGYYGNIMDYDDSAQSDHKQAWITINVKPGEKWSIANIPNGTTYVITEAAPDGYEFIKAEELETDGSLVKKVEKPKSPSITGTIRTSHTTKVEFTNKIKPPVFIKKVSADNSSITADGAEFDLYREFEKQTPTEEEIQNNGLVLKFGKYLQKVNASKIVSGTYELEDDENLDTDEVLHGYAMMDYLVTTDTYYMVETKAPDGYNSPTFAYIKLYFGTATDPADSTKTVSVLNWLAYTENSETHAYEPTGTAQKVYTGSMPTDQVDGTIDAYTVTVANNPGVELPASGGPGTKLIYLAGALLTLAAGLLLMHRGKGIRT